MLKQRLIQTLLALTALIGIQAHATLIHQDIVLSNVSGDVSAFGLDSSFTSGVIGSLEYDTGEIDSSGYLDFFGSLISMQLNLGSYSWNLYDADFTSFIQVDSLVPSVLSDYFLYMQNAHNDIATLDALGGAGFQADKYGLSGDIRFQPAQGGHDVPEPPIALLMLLGLMALRRFKQA